MAKNSGREMALMQRDEKVLRGFFDFVLYFGGRDSEINPQHKNPFTHSFPVSVLLNHHHSPPPPSTFY